MGLATGSAKTTEALTGYVTELQQVVADLAKARTAYHEACAQEVIHRAQTLRVRLEAGEPVTATNNWADIDSSTWVAEKLRRRAVMDNLADRRDMLLAIIPLITNE